MNSILYKYKKLSRILLNILNDKASNDLVYAIDSLNIVKPHSDFLNRQLVFFKFNFISFILKTIINSIKWLIKFLINSFWNIFYKKQKINFGKFNVIIFSHIINKNFLKNSNDFIYGKSLNFIKTKFNKIGFVYLNHTSLNSRHPYIHKNNNRTFILSNILSLKEELKIFYYQYMQVKKIFFDYYLKNKINFNFFLKIFYSIFSVETKLNLRYYLQFLNLFKDQRSNIKFIISTFEGFAWEKLLFSSIKRKIPRCKTIGYQHVGILKNEFYLKKINSSIYFPDYIFTCGTINKKIFLKFNPKYYGRVFVFGSSRSNRIKGSFRINKKRFCLVVPEGTKNECLLLFQYTLNIAKLYPQTLFIWRTHPLINLDFFLDKNPRLKNNIPKNIIISNKKFIYDIKRSTYVLYRGSSSVITALLNKLIPIYYDNNNFNSFEIDPLYLLRKSRLKVTTEKDYFNLITKYIKIDKYIKKKYFLLANSIYTPFNKRKIFKILQKINN